MNRKIPAKWQPSPTALVRAGRRLGEHIVRVERHGC